MILSKQKCCLLLNGVSTESQKRIYVASQQGTLTLPDTWFRPPFWDLLMLQLLRPNSSNLPCLYSTFHLEYPLVLSRFCSVSQIRRNFYPTRNMTRIHVGLALSYVKLLLSLWKIYTCNLMAWYTNKYWGFIWALTVLHLLPTCFYIVTRGI